jgi:hypothetical protein
MHRHNDGGGDRGDPGPFPDRPLERHRRAEDRPPSGTEPDDPACAVGSRTPPSGDSAIPAEDAVQESLRIKRLEVIDPLTRAHSLDGESKGLTERYDDTHRVRRNPSWPE